MDERLRFVARLLDGEKMAAVCEEFGISRKTGYKIFQRYQAVGLHGLTDRSRRPYRHANALPMAVEKAIVRLKKEYAHWGAPKIRERLRLRWPDVACPAITRRRSPPLPMRPAQSLAPQQIPDRARRPVPPRIASLQHDQQLARPQCGCCSRNAMIIAATASSSPCAG